MGVVVIDIKKNVRKECVLKEIKEVWDIDLNNVRVLRSGERRVVCVECRGVPKKNIHAIAHSMREKVNGISVDLALKCLITKEGDNRDAIKEVLNRVHSSGVEVKMVTYDRTNQGYYAKVILDGRYIMRGVVPGVKKVIEGTRDIEKVELCVV